MSNSATASLLARFTNSFPHLTEMGAELKVIEIEYDSNGIFCDPPKLELQVWHPFIFDNRIIPSMFEEISVKNLVWDNTLPWTLKPLENIPLYVLESPSNYVSFVNSNIDLIRERLKSKNLSKEEALEAITGGFAKHLTYWHSLVCKFFK